MISDVEDSYIEGHQALICKKAPGKIKQLQEFLLGCMIGIFESDLNTKVSYKQQIIREIFSTIVITIQVVSLFWYPDMSLRQWSSYSTFWNCLRFFNYDYLFARLNLYTFYVIVSATMNISSIFIVILHCGFKYFNYNLPGILLLIAKVLIHFFSSLLLIPYLTTLLVVIKYSTFDYRYMQEYEDHSTINYNFGILGTILSLLILVIFIPITFIIEILKADLRHSVAHKNIKARSNSAWDLLCILFFIFQCFLFVFINKNRYEYRIVISLALAVYLLILEFRFLHYFNPVENSIQACKMGCISVCAVIFLFGYSTDNPTTLTLLCIFLLPLSCLFITISIHRKYLILNFNRINPKNQYTLEHSIRHLLVDKQCNTKSEVIEMLSKYFSSRVKKNALYIIWEVNFCVYIAKDERLGRIKLTKYGMLKQNIEAYVQKFRTLEKFKKDANELSEIKNLDRILSLDEAKKSDGEICLILLDLWSEISRKDPEIDKLRNFIKKVFDLSIKIKGLYESLSQEIRNSEVLDLYGLFLANILGEVEEGNAILKKKLNIKNSESLLDFKKLESYDETFGIILLSTKIRSFGTIAYMNEKAAAILKVSPIEMVGQDFNQFIPKPYSLSHNDHMLKHYKLCTFTELETSHASFLQNQDGYIFECKALIKLTAFRNKAYYIISFSQIKATRHIISISEEGQIYNHSLHLAPILGLEKSNYAEMNISDMIRGINISKLPLFDPVEIYCNNKRTEFVHIANKTKTEIIHMVLILTDISEIEKWKSQANSEQVEDFCDLPRIEKEVPTEINENQTIERSKGKKIAFKLNFIKQTSYISNANHPLNTEDVEEAKAFSQAPASSGYSLSISAESKFNLGSASKYILNTSKSIKKFQWILFFAVLSMIGTNIGILAYIIEQVAHTNSLDIFNHLGQIMFYIGSSANLVRSISSEIEQGVFNLTRDSEIFNQTIIKLSILQENVLSDKSQWSYCPSSKIVTENIIPVWEFDMGKPYLKKLNLYDIMTSFIKHVKNILEPFLVKLCEDKR